MFKKIISNLPFSPALVGQLGFYAKRLRKEQTTRKVGLVFMALALVVQSFAVFQAPEAANAASSNDMIYGGFKTRDDYLRNYDANTGNLKDLFNVVGISRADIQNTSLSTVNSRKDGTLYSWGHLSRFSAAQGERSYTVPTSSGGSTTFYYRPLSLSDTKAYTIANGSTYDAYVGTTSSGMWFALLKICGNLVLRVTPPTVKCASGMVGTYPNCTKQVCPAGTNGTYPNCNKPYASCEMLTINPILPNYNFTAVARAEFGASIQSYTYVIKRDGVVVATIPVNSTQASNVYTYTQSQEGNYTVQVTVNTSLGARTGDGCIKTFNIAPPEKCLQNTSILRSNPECQPCPGDPTLWIKDAKCAAQLIETKSAINTTQGNVNATTVTAKANDSITYKLNVQNKGNAPADVTIVEHIDDVTEYANVIDAGGGTTSTDTNGRVAILSWPKVTLKAGESITRMFTVKMMSTIPAMGQGQSNATSYDCRMLNTFGNNVAINVDCPVQKQIVEAVAGQLPHTGPTENMIVAGAALAVVVFFYTRSRQLGTEVRLIRRDFNTGTI